MWSTTINFAERYGVFLFGLIVLLLAGRLFGRDGWRWWQTRQRVLKVQRGQAQASDATLLYQRMLTVLTNVESKNRCGSPRSNSFACFRSRSSLVGRGSDRAYNELRFGGDSQAAMQMMTLLKRLETIVKGACQVR